MIMVVTAAAGGDGEAGAEADGACVVVGHHGVERHRVPVVSWLHLLHVQRTALQRVRLHRPPCRRRRRQATQDAVCGGVESRLVHRQHHHHHRHHYRTLRRLRRR